MKRTFTILGSVAMLSLAMISCGGDDVKDEQESTSTEVTTSKRVEAKVIDGESTVTITTSKDGAETIEVLTGEDAQEYLAKEKIDLSKEGNSKASSKVIIKSSDSEDDQIDVEEIMNSEEFSDLDESTKAEIEEALKEANSEIEVRTEKDSKVIVIEK